jgi:cell division inhibitor SepF
MAGMWRKTLVYLGLAEEESGDYDYDYEPEESPPEPARGPADGEERGARSTLRAMPTETGPRMHLVQPNSFNDAQEIGDKFRDGFSVLMNLQSADPELARRLVDFASGLAYGLHGSMQPAADRVFLITPRDVKVSAEDRRRFLEERGFFNQV